MVGLLFFCCLFMLSGFSAADWNQDVLNVLSDIATNTTNGNNTAINVEDIETELSSLRTYVRDGGQANNQVNQIKLAGVDAGFSLSSTIHDNTYRYRDYARNGGVYWSGSNYLNVFDDFLIHPESDHMVNDSVSYVTNKQEFNPNQIQNDFTNENYSQTVGMFNSLGYRLTSRYNAQNAPVAVNPLFTVDMSGMDDVLGTTNLFSSWKFDVTLNPMPANDESGNRRPLNILWTKWLEVRQNGFDLLYQFAVSLYMVVLMWGKVLSLFQID